MQAVSYEYTGSKHPHGMYTAKQIFEMTGMSGPTFRNRLKRGMTVNEAVDNPLEKRKKEVQFPCGVKNPYECTNCKYKRCICETLPAMPGEGCGNI